MEIVIPSKHIERKLAARGITLDHCEELFQNRGSNPIKEDTKHPTAPFKSYFFISETDAGRLLKISFIWYPEAKEAHIKTVFEPIDRDIDAYHSSA